ncbi:hypothetical protein P3X46_032189 [Hevea brasiliensis]|uniref:Uncharacterized protein n=1 Tax=Hevea brasiliensis TaxID=3981 RepID=A0ABQ9KD10_HEVBR|nr:uncharacterized protein LOC110670282 [Hevea brasiliensis]KAJ9134956.1 hypothetical protein P3X46_032189 [Hevea brasiliensis]KAJ9134957.1 hypothetical protein P3X46_032189 [Hevea brasiliensis]
MDSEKEREMGMEMEKEETLDDRKKGFDYVVLRLILAIIFAIFAFFSLSLFIGFIAVLAAHFSIATPISVPTQCRIVSSSVDLKSSKVCELGFLNYKAKYVFYPFERSKFRCRYDYYWASVFEVEYKDPSLGHTQLAFAEAPNEALPLNCRPSFGTAWLTKDRFKVNKTYECWYTIGISKVSIYRDGFFPCQAKDPSAFEMIRRYIILFMKILRSWFVQKRGKSSYWRWETIAGIVTGFSTSLISLSFLKFLQQMKSWLPQTYVARMVAPNTKLVFFKRACFLVAYFSVVGWLVIQYGKRLGLSEIYGIYNH